MIHQSETADKDPLEEFRKELKDLYATVLSRRAIKTEIDSMWQTHRDSYGRLAEFWLLLAVGAIIATPQNFANTATVYLAHASRCRDFDKKLLDYRILLHAELERRYNSTDVEMSSDERSKYLVVYLRAKRELGAIAPDLIDAY